MKRTLTVLTAGLGLILAPALAGAVTHTVTQEGLAFNPQNLTIEVGDTVEWIWTGGSHTVTSGTDLSDPEVGQLFDAPLNSANPSFSFTFTEVPLGPFSRLTVFSKPISDVDRPSTSVMRSCERMPAR